MMSLAMSMSYRSALLMASLLTGRCSYAAVNIKHRKVTVNQVSFF